jgi:hypothetical protein
MTLQVEVERIDIAEPENSGNMAVCVGWGGGVLIFGTPSVLQRVTILDIIAIVRNVFIFPNN